MPDYPYNITAIMQNNMTDFGTFTNAVNNTAFHAQIIGLFIMIIVFVVFFLAMLSKGYRASASVCIAMWATAVVTLLLRPAGMISDWLWWIGLALIPISILIMFVAREEAY